MLRDQFVENLKELGVKFQLDLSLSEDNDSAVLIVDDEVIVNISYLEDSDTVVLFSPVAEYTDEDDKDGSKAIDLLKLNDIDNISHQFTLMLDKDEDLVIAADRVNAENVNTTDELSQLIESLVDTVNKVHAYFSEKYVPEV